MVENVHWMMMAIHFDANAHLAMGVTDANNAWSKTHPDAKAIANVQGNAHAPREWADNSARKVNVDGCHGAFFDGFYWN